MLKRVERVWIRVVGWTNSKRVGGIFERGSRSLLCDVVDFVRQSGYGCQNAIARIDSVGRRSIGAMGLFLVVEARANIVKINI